MSELHLTNYKLHLGGGIFVQDLNLNLYFYIYIIIYNKNIFVSPISVFGLNVICNNVIWKVRSYSVSFG